MKRLQLIPTILLCAIICGCGGHSTPAPITKPASVANNPFPVGAHWTMVSNLTGGITTFDVLPQDHFGCEAGELVNLRITKMNTDDYWGVGATFYENFILLHEANGGWRAIGDFEQNYLDTSITGTTNLLRPKGITVFPYAITPGSGEENATLDTMYFWKQENSTTFDCIPGDQGVVPAPPGTGNGVNRWITQFTTDSHGNIHAHYSEFAPVGLSEEIWVFPASGVGLLELDQISNANRPRSLVLTRQ